MHVLAEQRGMAMLSDNIKWHDEEGFNHVTHVEAPSLTELAELIQGLQATIASLGGTPTRDLQAPRTKTSDPLPAVEPPVSVMPPEAPRIGDEAPAPAQAPSQGDGRWIELTLDATTYRVGKTESDKIAAKVYCEGGGYNFKVHGVRCWPEPFKEIGIDLERLPVGEYSLPADVTGVIVYFDPKGGRNNAGTPKKVKGFVTASTPAQVVSTESWRDEDIPF